jgi:hypothetical protein
MKKIILSLFVVLVVLSCADEVQTPVVNNEDIIKDEQAVPSRENSNGRPPTDGFELTWNGDGRWHGSFGGSPVWFWGPTPAQLDNNIQGEWPVTCAYYTPGVCYPDGIVVAGNGSYFTVSLPLCGGASPGTVTVPLMTAQYTVVNGTINITGVIWSTKTRDYTSLSSGSCKLTYYGKVIIGQNCRPRIVDISSTSVSLCKYVSAPI